MESPTDLRARIADPATSIDAIGAWLDGLSAEARLAETRTLDRAAQRALYDKAIEAAPMELADLVPPGRRRARP